MIEAYRIGVNLVMDPTKVTGPLGAVLKAFEAIQSAQRAVQAGLNELASGTRGATAATNRLAEAWRSVGAAAQAAGRYASAAGGSGFSGGASGATAPGPRSSPPPTPANSNTMPWLTGPGGALAPFYGYPAYPRGNAPPALAGAGAGGVATGGAGGNNSSPQLLLGGPGPLTLNYPGFGGGGGGSMPTGIGSPMAALNAFNVIDRLVTGIGRLTKEAAGFNDALVTLEQRGLGTRAVTGIEGTAFAIAAAVPGRTLEQITKDAGSLRAVLGESPGGDNMEAVKAFLPDVEKTAAALSGSTGISSEGALHMLFRAIEMRGGTIDPKTGKISPERFKTELNAVYKVLQVAGGIASERDILNLVQQGSIVAKTMENPDDFWKMMIAPLIDMKGSRAGTALQAAGRQLLGGIMSKRTAGEFGKIMGFGDEAFTSGGGGSAILKPELQAKILEDMKGGLAAFIEKDIRPGLLANGYKTEEQQNAEIFKIAGTDTFRRILSLFLSNADQVLKEGKLYDKVPAVETALNVLNKESIGYNMNALLASVMNFFEAAEKVNAPAIIGVMQALKSFMDFWTGGIANEEKIKRLNEENDKQFGSSYHYYPWEKGFWLGGFGAGPRPENLPGGRQARGTADDPIHTIVQNGTDLAHGMSNHQADQLSAPQTGPTGNNPRVNPLGAGMPLPAN